MLILFAVGWFVFAQYTAWHSVSLAYRTEAACEREITRRWTFETPITPQSGDAIPLGRGLPKKCLLSGFDETVYPWAEPD